MEDEFIYIKHPDVEVLGGPVSVAALPGYQQRGWEQASPEDVAAHEEGVYERHARAEALTTEEVNSVRKRAELDALALDKGIDPTQHDNMDSLKEALNQTLGET